MGWVLRLVETEARVPSGGIDVMEIAGRGPLSDIANLGLTLTEAKQLLGRAQQVLVAAQAHDLAPATTENVGKVFHALPPLHIVGATPNGSRCELLPLDHNPQAECLARPLGVPERLAIRLIPAVRDDLLGHVTRDNGPYYVIPYSTSAPKAEDVGAVSGQVVFEGARFRLRTFKVLDYLGARSPNQ